MNTRAGSPFGVSCLNIIAFEGDRRTLTILYEKCCLRCGFLKIKA